MLPQEPQILDTLEEPAADLIEWYKAAAADLPWRRDKEAYHVWISEIMLQQTRIEAVKPYYDRFIERYPDICSLASSNEEELMKLWEGLGYYSRARNLRRAACICAEKYGGSLPEGYSELISLPGIGSYTAAAVSSIAFGQKYAVVDGNVARVIFRLYAIGADAADSGVKAALQSVLCDFLKGSRVDPGTFNQAVMELGERVCLPKGSPACNACPVSVYCQARALGIEEKLPVRSQKAPRRIEKRTILVITDGRRVLLKKRRETGLLAGMYELPGLDGHTGIIPVQVLARQYAGEACRISPLPPGRHVFTHLEWDMQAWLVTIPESQGEILARSLPENVVFPEKEEIGKKFAVPAAFRTWKQFFENA